MAFDELAYETRDEKKYKKLTVGDVNPEKMILKIKEAKAKIAHSPEHHVVADIFKDLLDFWDEYYTKLFFSDYSALYSEMPPSEVMEENSLMRAALASEKLLIEVEKLRTSPRKGDDAKLDALYRQFAEGAANSAREIIRQANIYRLKHDEELQKQVQAVTEKLQNAFDKARDDFNAQMDEIDQDCSDEEKAERVGNIIANTIAKIFSDLSDEENEEEENDE